MVADGMFTSREPVILECMAMATLASSPNRASEKEKRAKNKLGVIVACDQKCVSGPLSTPNIGHGNTGGSNCCHRHHDPSINIKCLSFFRSDLKLFGKGGRDTDWLDRDLQMIIK